MTRVIKKQKIQIGTLKALGFKKRKIVLHYVGYGFWVSLIIVFAVILGAVIIYNMGVLSYSEKQYQFATLKVLGFKDKKIKNIFITQNIWITIASIIIGLPTGYYLTSWLFKACLDDRYDFGVHINISTYILATVGTFLVSYLVSKCLARKISKIDMVSSLKGNE